MVSSLIDQATPALAMPSGRRQGAGSGIDPSRRHPSVPGRALLGRDAIRGEAGYNVHLSGGFQMDDIVRTRPKRIKAISDSEAARRRKVVRIADAENRLEGISRSPETDAVFDAYVRGDIEVTEMVPRLKALLGIN
jgi:hypothetical protein